MMRITRWLTSLGSVVGGTVGALLIWVPAGAAGVHERALLSSRVLLPSTLPAPAVVDGFQAPVPANGSLNHVACRTAANCIAVGEYVNSAGVDMTLAEAWKPNAWKVVPTPNPVGSRGSVLSSLSCVSVSNCTAVGHYTSGTGVQLTLAEAWNGTTWKVVLTPNPAGALLSVLYGVSCTSASNCSAVGGYEKNTGGFVTLAEAWNGTAWKVIPTPNPGGSTSIELGSVFCTAASACDAVGYFINLGAYVTLAETWNGTAWKLAPTATPSGAEESVLDGVACVSVSNCVGVGYYVSSTSVQLPLVEEWNGATWKVVPAPTPSGAQQSILYGVTCTLPLNCTGVGDYVKSSGVQVPLAETWKGAAWKVVPVPTPTGAIASSLTLLRDISCTSASNCTAVGEYENSARSNVTLAEVWNGTAWKVVPTPNA